MALTKEQEEAIQVAVASAVAAAKTVTDIKEEEQDDKPKRDWYDFWDILVRAAIPVTVVVVTMMFSNQASKRQTTAAMAEIAVGIVSKEPEYEEDQDDIDPLRAWAIDVLKRPGDIVPLTNKAAEALKREGLPTVLTHTVIDDGKSPPELIGLEVPDFKSNQECVAYMEDVVLPNSMPSWMVSVATNMGVINVRLIETCREVMAKQKETREAISKARSSTQDGANSGANEAQIEGTNSDNSETPATGEPSGANSSRSTSTGSAGSGGN